MQFMSDFQNKIHNDDIGRKFSSLLTPNDLKLRYPLAKDDIGRIAKHREVVTNIIQGTDSRLLLICGPCSIHDPAAAVDYAYRLKALAQTVNSDIYIVMRTYFEKPRTTVGWKGFVNDPDCDGTCNIEKGLLKARELSILLTKIGLPLATEVLDPYVCHYFDDVFSWGAIGARTTESQIHREVASSLQAPIGFKNSTNGNVVVAVNSIKAASKGHHYIGINQQGDICKIKTQGNTCAHLILRGGKVPNYSSKQVKNYANKMRESGVLPAIIIDCSHNNSNKDYRKQRLVADSVVKQIVAGNHSIVGMMLESNINAGKQSVSSEIKSMQYGVSITDECLDWQATEKIVLDINKQLSKRK
ncbi:MULTISPECIES: 3-deoxy-7-phosphoheptulonate synthase [unclassified Psychrobacter]|uniref:3-deoxy-7-phosphoheptulonate synthase n=1 Tax=unclassified Psychrobacter TaxID=196806 RepID=UPI000B1B243A|nr:3-deoxy-7-phosphoheptulonate synthase [Psychrobacter sp. P11F6]